MISKIHTYLSSLRSKTFVTSLLLIVFLGITTIIVGSAQTGNTSIPPQRLVGYAWSENIGWISFNDGSKPVTVDAQGNLDGFAWSENIGWVKFGNWSSVPDSTRGTNSRLSGSALSGWARAVAGMDPAAYAQVLSEAATTNIGGSSATSEKWFAHAPQGYENSGIYLSRLPAASYEYEGEKFLVYEVERIYTGTLANFKNNPEEAIRTSKVLPIGNARDKRYIFNIAQLEAETPAVRKSEIINLKGSFHSRFACASNVVNATDCHRNNSGSYFPTIGYTEGGPIYVARSDSGGGATMGPGTIIGTYTLRNSVSANPLRTGTVTTITGDNRGGWDGWISLQGVTLSGSVSGNPPAQKFTGYAWGSDVVGWVEFDKVSLTSNLNSCTGPYGTVIADGQSFTYFGAQADDGSCQSE
ncbi:MAG: hypothetical protein FGM57_03845, partial [Candidatus Taylorbacteria bacterium]|nr:hypothetical protein [Candidatus Taylorbacteria bacterium]